MKLEFVNKLLGSKALVIKEHAPEILMVAGVVGVVGSTVLACKATLKCDAILYEANDKLETIRECAADPHLLESGKYTDQDRKQDLTIVYTQTAIKFAKLFGPPIILGAVSIGCIIGGHNILRSRNMAVMAAYRLVDEGFKEYRKRVVEEYGEDKDYMLRHNLRAETIVETEIGEDGKPHKVKKTKLMMKEPGMPSIYSRFFDEYALQWSKIPEYNLMTLRTQQNYFNDMLKVRGHVFLNEIFDALGMDRTAAGSVVGWKLDGNGDGYIDFGIYDNRNHDGINGHENTFLLDFNVDGVIWDLI